MSNWQHITIEPEDDQTESEIGYERLEVGANWNDLEIIHVEDGRFFVQAADDCNGEIDIGTADTLDAAKKIAEKWALEQIADMLKSLGADGIWLVCGAESPEFSYSHAPNADGHDRSWMRIKYPHGRILLVRFPASDGGEAGIEYL